MGFWSNNKGGSSQPKQSIRDQEADAEFAELIAALSQEPTPNPKDGKKRDGRDRGEIDNDTTYTSTFPGEMNCITAFDEMFYCYSIGGQFLNVMEAVYRYGGLRDCSEKSQDWRFCMRAKMYGPVTRKAMIMARNKEKAAKYKTGPSSEDIWKARKEPLESAFTGMPVDMETEKNDVVP
ncbi:hypothetical protein Q9L58_008789 [Maublancomyces gigas]|uniref:Uncharacterized protein n=1 Tax=Discina gigas TaxID=1032678 RepID=A0ABR3G9T7_9PEZI